MRVRLSTEKKGVIAIAGHAGCGHCHSHNQYLQDDSVGLATVLRLFQEATGLSLIIKEIRVETGINGSFHVHTVSGGSGTASPRRGITVHEARLAKSLEGRDAVCSQTLALEAFGRFYGQGVHEAPVALQTAIANAAVDSFTKNFPGAFISATENIQDGCGRIAGTILDFDGVPVAVLATVNATQGGLGPVEDLEGNAFAGVKKDIMRSLGMQAVPTLVIEGKVYAPLYSDAITQPTFLVRADAHDDNPVVAEAVVAAATALGYPVSYRTDVMKRSPMAIENTTKSLGDALIAAAQALKDARFSQQKVRALAELARLVSEDGAGVSFMSDRLHEIIGGTGVMPGTGAVLSYVVPKSYRDAYVFPFATEADLMQYQEICKAAIHSLHACLAEAQAHLDAHCYTGDLDALILT